MGKDKQKFETEAIRTQIERSQFLEHSSPLYLTSSFVFEDAEDMRASFADEKDRNIYSRYSNPNSSELIEKVYKGRIDEANNYLMQCIWYLYQGSQYDWPEFQLCNTIQPLRSNAISVVGAKESYLEPDVNNVPFGRGRGELGDNGRIINYYGIS